jgi:magnesium-transporting ATPase (P-type)
MYVFIAIGALIIFQLIITYVPFMNTMFGTSPIEWIYWVYVAASGLAVLIIVEAEKFMARRLARD